MEYMGTGPIILGKGMKTMKRLRLWIPASIALLMFAGTASATPVIFQFDSSTTAGGAFPSSTTPIGGYPIVGSGNIDFVAETGTLTLPDYSLVVDIGLNGPDSVLDITGWTQTITTFDDGFGNIASTGGGAIDCIAVGGIGSTVCGSTPTTVAGWPPPFAASSAVIDQLAQTITVIDASNSTAGTITSIYSYTIVPEPGTALLLGGGLMGLAMRRKQRLS
jgi:hypothetical protein